jgi:DNA gyrase/topoisomerase IV subunit B
MALPRLENWPDRQEKTRRCVEIYIVEGDFRLRLCQAGLGPETQAILLPLRGKILNVGEGIATKSCWTSNEILTLIPHRHRQGHGRG